MLNLAMLISGGGTTMQAIINECKSGSLKNIINPVIVIASRNCSGIVKAKNLAIPTYLVKSKKTSGEEDQQEYSQRLLSLLEKAKVDIITQNGWLARTPLKVIETFSDRIFNQHPGPLDPPYADFGGQGMFGLRVHAAVLYFSQMLKRKFITEVTVQYVAPSYDQGAILLRYPVMLKKTDTPKSLAQRVLPYEHQLQIKLLKLYVAKKLKIYHRQNRLVRKEEIPLLNQAKGRAMRVFPKG